MGTRGALLHLLGLLDLLASCGVGVTQVLLPRKTSGLEDGQVMVLSPALAMGDGGGS